MSDREMRVLVDPDLTAEILAAAEARGVSVPQLLGRALSLEDYVHRTGALNIEWDADGKAVHHPSPRALDAERVARALASIDGLYGDGPADASYLCCSLCGGAFNPGEGHDADCPWRMAREWVAEHPEGEG